MENIRLTQYSHGAGCGCKISPKLLDEILHNKGATTNYPGLLVGNDSKDDAAVFDLGGGQALISTTDFFMPIVDDPFDFGRIASANAISDVYAMGGKPIMAIAVLGWPIQKLPPAVANKVIEGSRSICNEAGIPLAGGHSIDSPEPIFGLSVNGLVGIDQLKQNNTAQAGDLLVLTKPLGVGILTTAEKKGVLEADHKGIAARQMMELNKIGAWAGTLRAVHAMTDVTGFGLLGHLIEMAEGSGLSAHIYFDKVPQIIPDLGVYTLQHCIPGGTNRNWESYGHKVSVMDESRQWILADPQTSGGLLMAVKPSSLKDLQRMLIDNGLEKYIEPIGELTEANHKVIHVL